MTLKTYKQIIVEQKSLFLYILFTNIIAGIAVFMRDPLHGIFGEDNYVTIHLIVEILVIFFSLSIAVQIWLVSKFNKSNRTIFIGVSAGFTGLF